MNDIWKRAQEAELADWKTKPGGSERERWKNFLNEHPSLVSHSKVLEIGCGPDGIIFHIQGDLKIGLDPLMKSYSEMRQKKTDVFYIEGVGENLPFKENSFSSIFCMNALDHTSSPLDVLKEIRRILDSTGSAFVHVYCYPKIDKLFFRVGYRDPADIFHPRKLTPSNVIELIKNIGFKIKKEEIGTRRPPIKPYLRTRKHLIHTISRTLSYILFPLSKKQLGVSIYLELTKL